MTLPLFVIYQNPSDYPGKYVVRQWRGLKPRPVPEIVTDTLEKARAVIPAGLTWLGRATEDDPAIVESWL